MKLYNSQVIKHLQYAIKNKNIKMNVFKDYSFLTNKITCGEITLHGYFDTSLNRNAIELIIYNTDIGSDYFKKWDTTAVGKFLIKDFKKDRRDFMNNILYYEVYYSFNNIKYKAIIRLLNEISDPDISEADKTLLIKEYGDIKIDDRYFSVIKVCFDDDRTTWALPDKFILSERNITDNDIANTYSAIIDNSDIINEDNNEEDNNYQDPLF